MLILITVLLFINCISSEQHNNQDKKYEPAVIFRESSDAVNDKEEIMQKQAEGYHEALNGIMQKDVVETLSSLAELSKTMETIGIPGANIFSTAAKETVSTLGPDYPAATLYALNMTATRLDSLNMKADEIYAFFKERIVSTDYYDLIHKPVNLMVDAMKIYNKTKNFNNFKKKCDSLDPENVINTMSDVLDKECELPFRIRTKRLRLAKEVFDLMESKIKIPKESRLEYEELKQKVLNKIQNKHGGTYDWFLDIKGKLVAADQFSHVTTLLQEATAEYRSSVLSKCILSEFLTYTKETRAFEDFLQTLSQKALISLQFFISCSSERDSEETINIIKKVSSIAVLMRLYLVTERDTAWPDNFFEISGKVLNENLNPTTNQLDTKMFEKTADLIRSNIKPLGEKEYHHFVIISESPISESPIFSYTHTTCISKEIYEAQDIYTSDRFEHNCIYFEKGNVQVFISRYNWTNLEEGDNQKWKEAKNLLENKYKEELPVTSDGFHKIIKDFMDNSQGVPYENYIGFYNEYRWRWSTRRNIRLSKDFSNPLKFQTKASYDYKPTFANRFLYYDREYIVYLF